MIKKLILALTCTTLFATAAAAEPPERTTIVDVAIGDPENFSTLVAAVVKADLVQVLDGRRKFTVFAPTNDAFDAAAEALLGPGNSGVQLVDALPVGQLTDVLLYHVAPGQRFSDDVLDAKKVRTISKDFLTPSLEGGVPFINDAEILIPDVETDNGVIHVIGGVLLPPMMDE